MTRSVRLVSHVALLAAVAAVVAGGLREQRAAAQPPLDGDVAADENARIAPIQKVTPAVVSVCVVGGKGMGSGVLIDPEGYALTNYHVVAATGPIMQGGLSNGVLYDAVV